MKDYFFKVCKRMAMDRCLTESRGGWEKVSPPSQDVLNQFEWIEEKARIIWDLRYKAYFGEIGEYGDVS
jgi:hypothetical protein